MGYSNPKKPFDLKEFLSEKASPQRRRWQYGKASPARKPAAEAAPKAPPEPPPDSET